MKDLTLKDYQDRIEKALEDNGGYSHNIISLTLRSIDEKFGPEKANETIEKLELEDFGWSKQAVSKSKTWIKI